MAKIGLNKLGLSKNNEVKEFMWNGQKIEILQYLSLEKKLEVISEIINSSVDLQGYYAPYRLDLFTTITVMQYYTNISFTEKQKEDMGKLYDLIVSSGLWDKILDNLDEDDYEILLHYIDEAIKSYYSYYNSVFGILDSINTDYNNSSLQANEIAKTLSDPENLTLLRDVIAKLG